jgi:hypothetical protein
MNEIHPLGNGFPGPPSVDSPKRVPCSSEVATRIGRDEEEEVIETAWVEGRAHNLDSALELAAADAQSAVPRLLAGQ